MKYMAVGFGKNQKNISGLNVNHTDICIAAFQCNNYVSINAG